MKPGKSRFRARLDPITDRLRPGAAASGGAVMTTILFAALVGIFPLALLLDALTDFGWLAASVAATALAAVLAGGAAMLIGR